MPDTGKKTELFIFGHGGHARVIKEIVEADGVCHFAGFVEKDDEKAFLDNNAHAAATLALGIGENSVRKNILETIGRDSTFPVLIHPKAIVAKSAEIGRGSVIMPGAIINPGAVIGEFCIINSGAIIEHDTALADFCSVAPGAILCGNCHLDEGAFIGAGAVLSHGLKAGHWSVLGAGSAAIRDLKENTVYAGAPAKPIGVNSEHKTVL